jgi:hypothetical protein
LINLENIKEAMQEYGAKRAAELQANAANMTSDELYENIDLLPMFNVAIKVKNMQERPIGFTCRTAEGLVVRLIENYDTEVIKDEPEFVPAYYKFFYSTNPYKALPFVLNANSPYMTNEYCVEKSLVYCSTKDDNLLPPSESTDGWKLVGAILNGKYVIY